MATRITSDELSKHLADILERVRSDGEDFVIEDGGHALARLTPPTSQSRATWQTLEEAWEKFPPDPGFADDLEEIHNLRPPVPPDPWQTS